MLRFGQAPKLRGITVVAGWSLNVPAAAFAAGSVMDSRTAMTRLPPPTYQALRAAFRPGGPEREPRHLLRLRRRPRRHGAEGRAGVRPEHRRRAGPLGDPAR
jgi:hypothetical protein